MVKECKVLINNDAVTVIDFDGEAVQIPSIKSNTRSVKAVMENGICKIVDDDYKKTVEKAVENKPKKVKKTTKRVEEIITKEDEE